MCDLSLYLINLRFLDSLALEYYQNFFKENTIQLEHKIQRNIYLMHLRIILN